MIIAHRGNVHGPSAPGIENSPDHLIAALMLGLDVEADVQVDNHNELVLAHDVIGLGHRLTKTLLNQLQFLGRVWFHAKSPQAFYLLERMGAEIVFFHNTDTIAYTTNGYFWTFPGGEITPKSILVMPETLLTVKDYANVPLSKHTWIQCMNPNAYRQHIQAETYAGICTDYGMDFL